MFKLFKKNIDQMGDKELDAIVVDAKQIEGKCKLLREEIVKAKSLPPEERQHEAFLIYGLLRTILYLLHHEEKDAKKAIRTELRRVHTGLG